MALCTTVIECRASHADLGWTVECDTPGIWAMRAHPDSRVTTVLPASLLPSATYPGVMHALMLSPGSHAADPWRIGPSDRWGFCTLTNKENGVSFDWPIRSLPCDADTSGAYVALEWEGIGIGHIFATD